MPWMFRDPRRHLVRLAAEPSRHRCLATSHRIQTRIGRPIPLKHRLKRLNLNPRRTEESFLPTILLLDRDAFSRETLGRILTNQRYRVLLAASDVQAIGRCENGVAPDLILVDLGLLGLEGCAFLQHLAEHPKLCAVPVIVLHPGLPLTAADISGNVFATFEKPISVDNLLQVMLRALQGV